MCTDKDILRYVLKDITHFVQKRLEKFEIPKNVTLVSDLPAWTPETGLVTAAMKIKRKNIECR